MGGAPTPSGLARVLQRGLQVAAQLGGLQPRRRRQQQPQNLLVHLRQRHKTSRKSTK